MYTFTFTFIFGANRCKPFSADTVGLMRLPSATKGHENLFVALANRKTV